MEYMSIEEFMEEGYLQEVNRLYFHIMGLALEVSPNTASPWGTFVLRVQDHRSDDEGVVFDDFSATEVEKAVKLKDEFFRRMAIRTASSFGFGIQPAE